jgi:3-isopropylmalate/(R)-2-methylmalate dehydratase small subunit
MSLLVEIKTITGSGVPLRGNDIDTDRIIPARFLKCVTFDGLGESAFADDIAALEQKGEVHPFRMPAYQHGSVLVSNSNFGCGSSREHAPQALVRWGIKAIIAESYSEIFFGNCVSLGVPCFKVSHADAQKILDAIEANPDQEIELNIEKRTFTMGELTLDLELADGPRGQFLDGSWNARAGLLVNADKVAQKAQELPYVNNFA